MPNRASSHPSAAVAWATASLLVALVVFTGALGLTRSIALAAGLAVAGCVATFVLGTRTTAASWFPTAPRALRLAFSAGALLALCELGLATTFIANPWITTWDSSPWAPMRSAHSCASAYWMAAQAVD